LSRKNALLACLLVVGICYANSLPNEFVLDDVPIVASNLAIRNITPIQFLTSPYWLTEDNPGIYRPFTIFSLSVDYALWHRWAPGFRLTNLLLHALNGWLIFILLSSLVEQSVIPIAAALIYLVHPVHTEAVTSIVGRSELLAALFFLSAWVLYRRGQIAWAGAVFFLSLLCKENAIVLPAVLAVETYLSQGCSLTKVTASWKKLTVMMAAAFGYLLLRFSILGGLGVPAAAQYMGGQLSILERWMTSGRVFLRYIRLVLVPVDIAGDYDFNSIPIAKLGDWDAWLGLVLMGVLVGLAWSQRRRNWVVSFGLLFTIIAFIPTSNLIMPISILMAERLLYLPMIGISLAAAVIFAGISEIRIQKLVAAGCLVTALLLCWAHNYVWRNDFTFYRNMVRVEPDNAKGRLGYGFALVEAGMTAEAAEELEAGLRIIPDSPALMSTLALTKMTPGSCAEARPLLNRALQINPNHGGTLRRVADCLLREGNMPEAEAAYRQALSHIRFPDSQLLLTWGQSLENLGQKDSAIAAYERAALIDPQNLLIKKRVADLSRH
jgi:protein O-mannosyl-transferase